MRSYGAVHPTFWTGTTGKQIRRAGRDAQLLALYLLTCPSANMTGLYYLPLPTIAHEMGFSDNEVKTAFNALSSAEFAFYDSEFEVVWVPNMARYQVGATLNPGDKRRSRIHTLARQQEKSPYFAAFLNLYQIPYQLDQDAPSKGHRSPIDAPAVPHRSPIEGASRSFIQEQEQVQEQEQEQDCKPSPSDASELNASACAGRLMDELLISGLQNRTICDEAISRCAKHRNCNAMEATEHILAQARLYQHSEQYASHWRKPWVKWLAGGHWSETPDQWKEGRRDSDAVPPSPKGRSIRERIRRQRAGLDPDGPEPTPPELMVN